ncbi:hypothetical protein AZI85_15975 [Bdellovibrio bacteriovorus]|uniref:Methyltransferase n=1 Tax=Bdellovibrio bacteriovorus TaxID=959 RepID=A0A150WTJ5_BDEBC|nr:class I SAM-dependent methyltransferase [Bdellovibrio bacteriovorus]KYG69890.1 hypothetical protein AZI85_15975 [Bdellovibrio bacteriovorus]
MSEFQKIDGIYFSESKKNVSYPEQGNDTYFEIEDKSFWFKHRNLIIEKVLKKYVPEMIDFYDLGGGNGFVAQKIASMGYSVTLVEAGSGVFNALKRGIDNVYCADIVGFKSTKPNAVVGLFDVIEHFDKPENVYKSIHENMPGVSKLILTVPAYNWLWSDEDIRAGHFRRYTMTSLRKELNDAGYEVVFSSYFFSFLILPIFLFRTVPYLLRKMSREQKNKAGIQEHRSSHIGQIQNLVEKLLSVEGSLLGKIPFGGSIIVVAKNKKQI